MSETTGLNVTRVGVAASSSCDCGCGAVRGREAVPPGGVIALLVMLLVAMMASDI
jgi:hypothetical protein